jgi:hypothetical protein
MSEKMFRVIVLILTSIASISVMDLGAILAVDPIPLNTRHIGILFLGLSFVLGVNFVLQIKDLFEKE